MGQACAVVQIRVMKGAPRSGGCNGGGGGKHRQGVQGRAEGHTQGCSPGLGVSLEVTTGSLRRRGWGAAEVQGTGRDPTGRAQGCQGTGWGLREGCPQKQHTEEGQ